MIVIPKLIAAGDEYVGTLAVFGREFVNRGIDTFCQTVVGTDKLLKFFLTRIIRAKI